MFSDSWKLPVLEAPSPKKHRTMLSFFANLQARPAPVPTGSLAPTIPVPPRAPLPTARRRQSLRRRPEDRCDGPLLGCARLIQIRPRRHLAHLPGCGLQHVRSPISVDLAPQGSVHQLWIPDVLTHVLDRVLLLHRVPANADAADLLKAECVCRHLDTFPGFH